MTDEPLPNESPPATASDEPTPPPPSSSNLSTGLLIGIIVVLVVVALVAVLGIGLAGGEPEASASAPVAVSPSASPSVVASVSASAEGRPSIGSGVGATWSTVLTVPGAAPGDVTIAGPGGPFVAVGAAGQIGCEICPDLTTYTGRVWVSANGHEWSEAPVTGLEGSTLSLVAAGPGGLVAFGRRAVDTTSENLVLVSADGGNWAPIANHPFEAIGATVLDVTGDVDVTGDASLYVAGGGLGEPDEAGRATLWISANGVDWETVYQAPEEGYVYQVVALDDRWVAIGELFVASEDPARAFMPLPVAWSSPDGRTWTRHDMPLPETAGAAAAHALAATDAGLVAVGYGEYEVPAAPEGAMGFAAWESTDGSTWTAAPVTVDMLEDIGGGFLVYAGPDRVFAIGSGCRCGTGLPGRWWTTPDGLDWTQHAETPPILHTVVGSIGLLAVGQEDGQGAFFVSQ